MRRFQDEIDAAIVANEAIMLRGATGNTIMLVEGAKDHKVFASFVDSGACDVIIAHGQENALGALEILRRRQLAGVICVIDSDFSLFMPLIEDNSVVRTDLHDLEVMMIKSRAFQKILVEYGSAAKIANIQQRGDDPLNLILNAAHPLGILRHYSIAFGVHLDFDEFGTSHIDRSSLKVDLDRMIIHALRRSRKPESHLNEIKAYVRAWLGRKHDVWHMCCGHDLAEALGKSFQVCLGSQNANAVNGENIERALRFAYEWTDFTATRLYLRIREWEARNAPFRCLRLA